MPRKRPAPRRRSASRRRRCSRHSTLPAMAAWTSRVSSTTCAASPENSMSTFKDARAFLLKHRTDYDAAVKGFRWPDPVPFNWALDWFDAELARDLQSKDIPALWIVDAGS